MRLRSINVVGLHGFIDEHLKFFEDYTIIVGKNGSGKTSILNLAANLLRLDLAAIANTKFQEAQLALVDSVLGEISIAATNSAEEKSISVQIGDNEPAVMPLRHQVLAPDEWSKYVSVSSSLFFERSSLLANRFRGNATADNSIIEAASNWSSASQALAERTYLKFVRLDRTVLSVEPQQDNVKGDSSPSDRSDDKKTRGGQRDPIEDVLQVTRQKYLEFRSQVEQIQKDAAQNLLRLHFSPIKQLLTRRDATEKQLQSKLQELRQRVAKSQLVANVEGLQNVTDAFFKEFDDILLNAFSKAPKVGRRSLHEESINIMINLKQHQLNELFKIFEQEQRETALAFSPIRKYLAAASRFLQESGKRLEFSPVTLQLGFSVPAVDKRNKDSIGQLRSVRELSSGERQILVVLTYLAFLAGDESIFIIDEPELSLHLAWQRYLVEALKDLRPSGCQIIMATHAPEIAGRARSNAVLLNPSYLASGDSESNMERR